MQWDDNGLILHVGKYSETSAIVTLFTESHGLYRSIVKGGLSKRQRGVLQPGNLVDARWSARLAEHMGNLTVELRLPVAAAALQDAVALSAVASLCGLLNATQIEHDPHPNLYRAANATLTSIAEGDPRWIGQYVHLELGMLREGGFGLDLARCAATGSTGNLIYVSPKSGRAVSREAGAPYRNRLLALPDFLLHEAVPEQAPEPAEILDALRLTGYFLEHWLLSPHERRLPSSRARLVALLGDPPSARAS